MPGFAIGDTKAKEVPNSTQETARRHRWRFVSFDPIGDIRLNAHKAARPKPQADRLVWHYKFCEFYYPGKVRWQPITVSFYQTITDSGTEQAARLLYAWFTKSRKDRGGANIVGPKKSKQACQLAQLAGTGSPIYQYDMYGCWPSEISPDELDYTSTEISEVSFTLQMDWAEEKEIQADLSDGFNAGKNWGGGGGGSTASTKPKPSYGW